MATNKSELDRRGFFRRSGLAAAALSARSYGRVRGANHRLRIGIIGCGKIAGSHHLPKLLKMSESANVEVVAVSDVFRSRAKKFQERISKAGGRAIEKVFHQDLLEMKDLDYVVIATPEHWHHRQTLDALDAGKHVYCEKPMTHTIPEAQEVVRKVRETGLELQVGVQGMSDDSYSSANRAIRAGKLGTVVEAQMEYVRNHPLHKGPWRRGIRSDAPKPRDLDWNRWLGPAPKRPWSPHRFFEWRNYRDYSGGISTDLFIHRLTRVLKACELTFPNSVAGLGGIYIWDDGRDVPDNLEMIAEYPAVEGITNGMTLHMLGTMANKHGVEHCIRGHKATLVFTRRGWKILDQGSGKVVKTHRKTGAEDMALHHRNLQAAIRDGKALACPAELGLRGVVAVVMCNESWARRKLMTWDYRKQEMVEA